MDELAHYRHSYQVKLRFSDYDIMQHVNNTRFLTFIEDARISYLEQVLKRQLDERMYGAIVAHLDIDYLHPIVPGDTVEVVTRTTRIGNKSIALESLIIKRTPQGNTRQAARCTTVIVSYNYQTGQTVPNQQELVDAILAYEPVQPQRAD